MAVILTTLAAGPLAANDRLDKWQKKLELTDEQAAKLKTIHESHKAAVEPLRKEAKEQIKALRKLVDDKKASDKDITAALDKLHKTHDSIQAERKKLMEESKTVLTPRQQAKAALMLMKGKAGMKKGWMRKHRKDKEDDER